MKNKTLKEDKISVFGKLIGKVKDFFYDLSVRANAKKPKKEVLIRSKNFNRKIFYWCMLIIPFAHYLIFYIGVNINSILLAFKHHEIDSVTNEIIITWAGAENFLKFFNEFRFGTLFKDMLSNSLIYYLIGLIVGLPCALVFSFYIYKKYFLSEFFRVILFLPSMISAVVTSLMYKYMVDYGVPEFLANFGVQIEPLTSIANYQLGIVIFFNIIMSFGVNIVMYASAMTRIPVSVVEYAALDGVKPIREFITITIPLIFDTISTFLIVGVSSIFVNQANIYALYSHKQYEQGAIASLGYHLYIMSTDVTEQVFPLASAMGITFTIIAIPLTFGVRWLLGKINPDVQY